jgi:hypothetical protein
MKNLSVKNFVVAVMCGILLMMAVPSIVGHSPALAYLVPGVAFGAGFIAYLAPRISIDYPSVKVSGVNVEVWVKYITERLWKDNLFLKHAYNDDDNVVAGRIVHIPQPGAKPAIVKNRAAFPAAAVRRTDTDITYVLDEYSTDPTHLPDVDRVHLSYDKMDSAFGEHAQVLNEIIADDMLIKWGANAASIVRTTGGAGAGTVAGVNGQTGTRKGFHHKDLVKAMTLMNTQNVLKSDRYCMIDDNMFEFFYDSLSDNAQKNFSEHVDAANGVVGRIHGFNILTRSSVLAADNADALKALGAALAATDNLVSLAWQKNSVARAIGDVKMFQDLNNPLYYGDIHSALIRMGGRVRRANSEGIVRIIQAA